MPYFVYRVFPFRRLEQVEVHASFQQASARAKALRRAHDKPPDCAIKVVFAGSDAEAEDLLSEVRAPKPGLVDDE